MWNRLKFKRPRVRWDVYHGSGPLNFDVRRNSMFGNYFSGYVAENLPEEAALDLVHTTAREMNYDIETIRFLTKIEILKLPYGLKPLIKDSLSFIILFLLFSFTTLC